MVYYIVNKQLKIFDLVARKLFIVGWEKKGNVKVFCLTLQSQWKH